MKTVDLSLLNKVKHNKPLVLLINNYVTSNNVANAVSFAGGSPIVIEAVEEAEELVKSADAICINLGSINQTQENLINTILKINSKYHRPITLDPVACGSSQYRLKVANHILNTHLVSCIRANAGEIAGLLHQEWSVKGIDSGHGDIEEIQLAKMAANKFKTIVALTGECDYISDGIKTWTNTFTNQNFPKYVGTGDMLSAIIATFLTQTNSIKAVIAAITYFTECGQLAKENGTASWFTHFNDLLGNVTKQELISFYREELEND